MEPGLALSAFLAAASTMLRCASWLFWARASKPPQRLLSEGMGLALIQLLLAQALKSVQADWLLSTSGTKSGTAAAVGETGAAQGGREGEGARGHSKTPMRTDKRSADHSPATSAQTMPKVTRNCKLKQILADASGRFTRNEFG